MQHSRRRIYRRRRILVFGTAAVVLGAGIYLPTTLLAPVKPIDAIAVRSAEIAPVDVPVAWPSYGASAIGAVGYPAVLEAAGSAEPLPIASITKVITALVALEAKPLEPGAPGPTITFDAADAALSANYRAVQGKVAPMPTGSALSQLDTMKVVLVVSANNYAEAFADWAFGSREGYIAAVDAWLDRNGLDDTTIVEPTGIDPGNVSTASDLVDLGKLALADPIVSEIVKLPSVSYPRVGNYANTNELLGIDGVDGIKTGTLDPAGSNLLFSADYAVGDSTVTLVGVVLGSRDHDAIFPAVSSLLDSAEAGFRQVTLVKAGQAFATYSTAWGESADAVARADVTAVFWSEVTIESALSAAPLTLAPKGSDAGSIVFTAGEQRITVPLVLDTAITDPGPWWRLGHPLDAFGIAG